MDEELLGGSGTHQSLLRGTHTHAHYVVVLTHHHCGTQTTKKSIFEVPSKVCCAPGIVC